MKRAYSYVRFSTAEQLQGKSLERQTEAARNYCVAHKLELDTELSLQDLGVSAFRGKNADTGALGLFLKAVHAGQVPQGSFLLIEAFDRMSRESTYDAQITLQSIINAGITVVTLMDGKQYNVDILRKDPISIIMAIVLMMRGHEESATKSKRIADAWRRKREDLKTGKMLTSVTPGWIKLDARGKPRVIPERAKIVRRIFEDFLSGIGRTSIVINLNKEHVPTFGSSRLWTRIYIGMVLTNRAVLGEFQPRRREHNGNQVLRVAEGEPIKNYWPVVVDVRTFNRTQTLLERSKGRRETRTTGLKNPLAGLARCPKCGGLMLREICRTGNKTRPPLLYYSCNAARSGGDCTLKRIPFALINHTLIAGAAQLAGDVPDTSADLLRQVAALEAQREEMKLRIEDTARLVETTPSRTLAARIQQDEGEVERLQAEIDMLNQQILYGGARRVRDSVSRMKSALQWHATDPSDVAGVNAALRECFERIVIDYPTSRLVLHWRHGQTTTLPYRANQSRRGARRAVAV